VVQPFLTSPDSRAKQIVRFEQLHDGKFSTKEFLFEDSSPHGLVALEDGCVLVGHSGRTSPGTDGSVVMYTPTSTDGSVEWVSEVKVEGIASNKGLELDEFGNLYCWGMADDAEPGLVVIPGFSKIEGKCPYANVKALSPCTNVNAFCLAPNKTAFISTSRGENAIWKLSFN